MGHDIGECVRVRYTTQVTPNAGRVHSAVGSSNLHRASGLRPLCSAQREAVAVAGQWPYLFDFRASLKVHSSSLKSHLRIRILAKQFLDLALLVVQNLTNLLVWVDDGNL